MTDDELKRLFEVTIERVDHRFDLLAESVVQLDRKLDRTEIDLRTEMKQAFADTQANDQVLSC